MKFGFVKCGPNEVIVVSGCCHRKPLLIPGGRTFVWPLIQRVQKMFTGMMTLEIKSCISYTNQGMPVTMTGIAHVKIDIRNREALLTACELFLDKPRVEIEQIVMETLQGHQSAIIGLMTIEEIHKNRISFCELVVRSASKDLSNMGIVIVSYTVYNLKDEVSYIANLGMIHIARIKRDARIKEAEVFCDTQIRKYKAEEEQMLAKITNDIKIVRAEKDHQLRKVTKDAEANLKIYNADIKNQLQAVMLKKKILREKIKCITAEGRQQVVLNRQNVELRKLELNAMVRIHAEAELHKMLVNTEARKKVIKSEGEAEADKIRILGEANTFAHKAKYTEILQKSAQMAEIWDSINETGLLEYTLENLPKIIANIVVPLCEHSKITIKSYEGGDVGMAKLTSEINKVIQNICELVKTVTGIDITEATRALINI